MLSGLKLPGVVRVIEGADAAPTGAAAPEENEGMDTDTLVSDDCANGGAT